MILETERLILRPWTEEDAEECYRYAKDPAVGPPAGWPPHTSVEDSRKIIREVLSDKDTFAMVLKETGLPIGAIGLHHNDLAKKDDELELGYWVGVPYWGQGLVPEAAREVLRYAFEDLGMARVWCAYYEGNEKSARVQEKLGFRPQWVSENMPVPAMGEMRTGYVNLMTKEEWLTGRILEDERLGDPDDIDALLDLADYGRKMLAEGQYPLLCEVILHTIRKGYYEAFSWLMDILQETFGAEDGNLPDFVCELGRSVPGFDEFSKQLGVGRDVLKYDVENEYDENEEIKSFFNICTYGTKYENIYLVTAENIDNKDNDYILYRLLATGSRIS